LSTENSRIGVTTFRSLTLNGTSNVALDVSLKTGASDKVQAETVEGTGTLNVSSVNVVTNSKTPVEIEIGKDSVVGSVSTNKAESAEATYKVTTKVDENGLLKAVISGQKAKAAAIAAPIAAQIGGYLAQINSYDQAFGNLDTEMLKSSEERKAEEMMSKYACASGCATVAEDNTINLNSKGLWNRAFATFEKVNLNGGPNVSNVGYGNYFGGDMGKKALSNGWSRQMSAYIGYNGSTQDYAKQCIDQNGGTIGLMETWYKGNFFTALTANVGGNNAQAHTDIGRENMSMLMAGVASKTGYNFEFKNGKFIVQPSLLVSYSFIHTFEHNNGLGHRVSSDPIHAIQVAPGVKFVANLKNGWQPYMAVNMRWNIMDKASFNIPDVTLPTMSVKPYVEYGVGVQKRWGERLTGYGQAMIRNGGRNGVMLSIGFKWAIGK
jgi:outer membrane autotransporter protein